MNPDPKEPPLPGKLAEDYKAWLARKSAAPVKSRPTETDTEFEQVMASFKKTVQSLPENVSIPYHMTPEGERAAAFQRVCPKEFYQRINPKLILNPGAFKQVSEWDGKFPGPLAVGPTDNAKTRATWVALGRLCVKENKSFRWDSAKRLSERYFEAHMDGDPEIFWRAMKRFDVLFFDDIDKLEMNDRNAGVLFEFYDWTYRENRPVIGTTNRNREWWVARMGEAFVRRMFDEAHRPVFFL